MRTNEEMFAELDAFMDSVGNSPAEMIAILQREDLSKEQMEELFFDLSPYSRNKKKQG